MRLAGQTREDGPERPRVRMAIVSPTIDKRRVTERRIAEEISHLADRCEFHLCGSRSRTSTSARLPGASCGFACQASSSGGHRGRCPSTRGNV